MFDDQQTTGGIPPNLPVGEPEDMFAQTDPNAAPVSPPVGDATAPPSAMSAGVLQPKVATPTPVAPSAPPTGPQAPGVGGGTPAMTPSGDLPPVPGGDQVSPLDSMTGAAPSYVKEPALGRTIAIIVASLAGIAVLGGGGYIVYQTVIADDSQTLPTDTTSVFSADQTTTEVVGDDTVVEQDTTAVVPVETSTTSDALRQQQQDEILLFGNEVPDRDGDNLADDVERDNGTDPDSWDTDGDGLSDGEEAQIWGTDPLNPDTDGDTYLDGMEVSNGYNPNGPGRLFGEPPTSTAMSSTTPTTTTSTP